MMDYDKIRKLANDVEDNLPNCDLEEILYMTKMMCQAATMVEAYNSDEASHTLEICDNLCDAMADEIYRRVFRREALIADGERILAVMEGLNVLSNRTIKTCHNLYKHISLNSADYDTKNVTRKCARLCEIEMMKRGIDFMAVDEEKTYWGAVPSPSEIIEGKSPPNIPNT